MTDLRFPTTVEEALADCEDALRDSNVSVIPTTKLMAEMLALLVKLKHA